MELIHSESIDTILISLGDEPTEMGEQSRIVAVYGKRYDFDSVDPFGECDYYLFVRLVLDQRYKGDRCDEQGRAIIDAFNSRIGDIPCPDVAPIVPPEASYFAGFGFSRGGQKWIL